MRKTKIVGTLGPASRDREQIAALIDAGLDAVRLNFSHGNHQQHAQTITLVREIAAERGCMIPIIADLQGPKIRTGTLEGGSAVELRAGAEIRLTPKPIIGSAGEVSIDYPSLARDTAPGDRVLLDDGAIELRVGSVQGQDVVCEIVVGGMLKERKGVNIPGATLDLPSITAKDKRDLAFAVEHGADYAALSFVRRAEDVAAAQDFISRLGADTPVIAKLEKQQAIENLAAILETADGVMVARGDLGVELSPWRVPIEQKRIIEAAGRTGKPVITATQMLESMIERPSPTRAEASDVANAVFDGSDALMLSGETAVGDYPVKAVEMMGRIIEEAEASLPGLRFTLDSAPGKEGDLSSEVARSAARLAEDLGAKFVVVYTESGYTARLVSKHRPRCSILGLSRHESVCRRMKLLWGVRAKRIDQVEDLDHLVAEIDRLLRSIGWAREGDLVLIVAGTPFQTRGKTDLIKLHRIGEDAGTG